jgi:3D (Asp-Asp-Asp) domain-containing protein
MKSLFGGGAVFATALLTASVLFYAHPLAAEPAFQNPTKQQQKKESATITATVSGSLEIKDQSAAQAMPAETAVNVAPDTDADNDADSNSDSDEAPPTMMMAPATTKSGDKNAPELIAAAAAPQTYLATAYNLPGRTASGRPVSKGIIAADPGVLPLGTRVRIEAGAYSGEYLVADTGGGVRGRKIDVWVPTMREACRFGRRSIKLTVLAYGGKRQKAKSRR